MKDAKGHGSNPRGGAGAQTPVQSENAPFKSSLPGPHFLEPNDPRGAHSTGVQQIGITHPIYNTPQKVRGYSNQRTPLNADYNTAGGMLRQRTNMSKDEHKAAGDAHIAQAMAMDAQHRDLVSSAMNKLGMESPGPLVSGIVSNKFSEGDKNQLRDLAHGSSAHKDAAFAHYAASGMRLDTARSRYRGLKGS